MKNRIRWRGWGLIVVLGALLLLPMPARGLVFPAVSPDIIAQRGTGKYRSVALADSFACCAAGEAGIDIIDISDPGHPRPLANLDTPGQCWGVWLEKSRLYFTDNTMGLGVADLSDPANPVLVARCPILNGNARCLQVRNNLAYVTASRGLRIVDVSRPWAPVEVGSCPLPVYVYQLEVDGNYAYLAAFDAGLVIVDISDPAHPVPVGRFETDDRIRTVGVGYADGVACLALGKDGLLFLDVSRPEAPRTLSEVTGIGYCGTVKLADHLAYVGKSSGLLSILDIADPANPVVRAAETPGVPAGELGGVPYAMEVRNGLAGIACLSGGLGLVRVSNPDNPAKEALFFNRTSGMARSVEVVGERIYLARSQSGLEILDAGTKPELQFVGRYPGNAECVAVLGSFACIGTTRTLKVIDCTDPQNPAAKGSCELRGYPASLTAAGNDRVLVAERSGDLELVGIGDPLQPSVISGWELPDSVIRVRIAGSLAYAACERSGLQIVDLNSEGQGVLGSCDTPEEARDVAIVGHLAYVADNSKELQIVDVTDPAAPAPAGSCKTLGWVQRVQVVGNRLCLASARGWQGVCELYDISDPLHPVFLRAWDLPGRPADLVIAGNRAYVACEDAGCLLVLDLDSPARNLCFPHAACGDGWETEVALFNTGSSFVWGWLVVRDEEGQELKSFEVTLVPWARREFRLGDLLPAAARSRAAYLVYESGSDRVAGYLKFSNPEAGYRVALPAVAGSSEDTLYVSHVASEAGWWTGIALVNTSPVPVQPLITFSDGRRESITLEPGAHRSFSLRDLFGAPQPGVESAVITNCRGVTGLKLFGGSGTRQLSGISLSGQLETTLYYPHVVFADPWWTGLVAYDPTAANRSFTVTPYAEDGTGLPALTLPLAPGQKKFVANASSMDLPPGTAWLEIEAASPITGFELFGTADGDRLGGYTGVGIRSRIGLLPKIDHRGWTGIALVNPGSRAADMVFEARDNNGVVVASRTLVLAPHAKQLGVPEVLFPDAALAGAAYIDYRSDRELVAFQLNGQGVMLDALPALKP
jgi:hypothetical protein